MRPSGLPCVVALILIFGSLRVSAQCPSVPIDGNLTTVDGSILAGGSCVLPGHPDPIPAPDNWLTSGGWIKAGSLLYVHSKADTSGKCLWGYWLNGCTVVDFNDLRTVNKIINRVQAHQWLPPQDMSATDFSIFARNAQGTTFRQHVDTQDANSTTGPLALNLGPTLGRYDFSFWSVVDTTNCNILPGQSDTVTASVNVVACAPNFRDDNKHIPNDGQVIDISVPTGENSKIDIAIKAAIAGWRAAGVNIVFNPIYTTCGPITNTHCVQVSLPNGGVPGNAAACAGVSEPPLAPNGDITQTVSIYLRSDASGWDQPYLNYLIAHELAHTMSLEHQSPACVNPFTNVGLSVANLNSDQLGCNHMDNLPSGPEISDAFAIMASIYSNNPVPKKSCK